jgi:DNA-binding beta-propeller fold protein YncE
MRRSPAFSLSRRWKVLPRGGVPPAVGLALVACLHACGSGSATSDEAGAPTDTGGAGGSNGPIPGGEQGADAGLPPEKEIESSYVSPVATGHYVWIANPDSGRVAFIDATTFSIRLALAGHAPTHLAAIPRPDADAAIVLNVLSRDATLLTATPDGLTARSFPVPSGGNAWAVSPDARWAIAWTDAGRVATPDPIEGYQDIVVLGVAPGAESSTPLTVGYRPHAISFDAGNEHAYVVTDDGIAIVDLVSGAPSVIRNVTLATSPLEPIDTRDVAVTPDGAFAVVRRDGDDTVAIVALSDGARTEIKAGSPVTDVDLSPDGSVAIAVARDAGEVLLLPLPGVVTDPSLAVHIDVGSAKNVIGSVALAKESSTAFLYSTAAKNPLLTVLDVAADSPQGRPILLRAPVGGVFPTRDATHAIVLHDTPPVDAKGNAVSTFAAAVSIVPVTAPLPPRIQGLHAKPTSIAIADDGTRALIATGGSATSGPFEALIVKMPSLQIETYELASPPLSAGIVAAAGRGFVAQKHPEGRITFIDLDGGAARTLTGFELAAEVVYGGGEHE